MQGFLLLQKVEEQRWLLHSWRIWTPAEIGRYELCIHHRYTVG